MKCKGCGESKKLIKAHVIPESFFVSMKSSSKPLRLITNTSGVYPKKSPIGVYDQNILCRQCEDKFQQIDDYGYRVLIGEEDKQTPQYDEAQLVGYRINKVDVSKLKLFFISILWRASISEQQFYSKVKLGSLEDKAQKLIWDGKSGELDDFSFVLAKFDDVSDGVSRTLMDPHPESWFDVNYHRFYLYGYILYIKTDVKETPSEWKPFISHDDNLIVISRGRVEDSKEFPILVDTIRMQKT
ncbi:hypothetical protein L4C54_02130 [Vibrio lamellibrachiae]|uniref:hypothetical protein n=1 Tax=Vibrio lamellibrachiae TaxID=2910253 RepID=UPI003D0A6EE2